MDRDHSEPAPVGADLTEHRLAAAERDIERLTALVHVLMGRGLGIDEFAGQDDKALFQLFCEADRLGDRFGVTVIEAEIDRRAAGRT